MEGGLLQEAVRRTIRLSIHPIRTCYQRRLPSMPDLAGGVTARFAVGPDGSVAGASIASSTLSDDAVESCILDVIRGIRFPPPAGGGTVLVLYPFAFSSTTDRPGRRPT